MDIVNKKLKTVYYVFTGFIIALGLFVFVDSILEFIATGYLSQDPSYNGLLIYAITYGIIEFTFGLSFIGVSIFRMVKLIQNKANKVNVLKYVADFLTAISVLLFMFFFVLFIAGIFADTLIISSIIGMVFAIGAIVISLLAYNLKNVSSTSKCILLYVSSGLYIVDFFIEFSLFVLFAFSVMGVFIMLLDATIIGLILALSIMLHKEFLAKNDSGFSGDEISFETHTSLKTMVDNNTNSFDTDIARKLSDLKKLKEQGIISQEQYEAKQKELLDKFN